VLLQYYALLQLALIHDPPLAAYRRLIGGLSKVALYVCCMASSALAWALACSSPRWRCTLAVGWWPALQTVSRRLHNIDKPGTHLVALRL